VQVTVEPEALAEWSAHARRSGTQLHARLAALDRDIAPLARTWHGAAADGFADRHRQWRHAASGLFRTLDRLAALMEAARANYLAAETANHRTWQPSSVVVVHAMAAGRGRIRADVEDIRASVRAVLLASDDLVAAWTALAARLTDSVAMAGGDDAGAMFGADHDVMAAAAWQGWRSCLLMIDGIAGGLAVTGNNLADAERKSTAGPTAPFLPIAARGASVPGPGPPPAAGGAPAEQLEVFWPTADPDRLRNAADAWRASAAAVHRSADAVFAAVDRLTSANTDATLAEMRRFTRAALSTDPTSGLVGVLAGTGGRIASACSGLADLTERTRGRIRDTVVHYASGDEWYHPVADVLDVFVRFKPGRFLATAEDAYLLQLALSSIHDEHVRAVASLRGELHPAGSDRLARIATAMAPPTPVPADTCMLASPDGGAGEAVPGAQRQALVDEVVAAGHKISPADVVQIARAPDGRVVWLERGDDRSGLSHILRAGRIGDFARRGVAYADIPGLALRAVTQGRPLGQVRDGGVAYDVDLGGGRHTPVVVVVGSNGYIVTARPLSVDEMDVLQQGGHR
jgi:WXG100 family type VII secretion target